jgi:hypothetical protein
VRKERKREEEENLMGQWKRQTEREGLKCLQNGGEGEGRGRRRG